MPDGLVARSRRLDQAPLPRRCRPGNTSPFDDGPTTPIWLPRTWLPEAPGSINTPCIPLPPMTLLSCGSVPPTVALSEPRTTPCCVLPRPISSTVFGAGKAIAGVRVHGIGQVLADEIALDQVADVGGIGDRDADAEAFDGQAPEELFDALSTNPCPSSHWHVAAIDDHAHLRIVAVDRGGRIGNRRDQGRAQDHAADGRGLRRLPSDSSSGQVAGRDQVRDRLLAVGSLKGDDHASRFTGPPVTDTLPRPRTARAPPGPARPSRCRDGALCRRGTGAEVVECKRSAGRSYIDADLDRRRDLVGIDERNTDVSPASIHRSRPGA